MFVLTILSLLFFVLLLLFLGCQNLQHMDGWSTKGTDDGSSVGCDQKRGTSGSDKNIWSSSDGWSGRYSGKIESKKQSSVRLQSNKLIFCSWNRIVVLYESTSLQTFRYRKLNTKSPKNRSKILWYFTRTEPWPIRSLPIRIEAQNPCKPA